MEMPCFLAAFAGNIDLWSAMWARGGGGFKCGGREL